MHRSPVKRAYILLVAIDPVPCKTSALRFRFVKVRSSQGHHTYELRLHGMVGVSFEAVRFGRETAQSSCRRLLLDLRQEMASDRSGRYEVVRRLLSFASVLAASSTASMGFTCRAPLSGRSSVSESHGQYEDFANVFLLLHVGVRHGSDFQASASDLGALAE